MEQSFDCCVQPREMPSRCVEMSYMAEPPGYDPRHQPNGEPPGYLDTSQRSYPRDGDRAYIMDERGYPLDDHSGVGYAPATRGYADDRDDFRQMDQRGFPQEFSERDRGYDVAMF